MLSPTGTRLAWALLLAGSAVSGQVHVVSAGGFIAKPANYFDLEGKSVRFTPAGASGYTTEVTASRFSADRGARPSPRLNAGWRVALPFEFPFGGQRWTEVFANDFGNLTFGALESALYPSRNPWADGTMRSVAHALEVRSAQGLERMIAVLWAPYEGVRATWARTSPSEAVITWEVQRQESNYGGYESRGPNVFQARLTPSGVFELSYEKVSEKDGIVGVFPGTAPLSGSLVDRVEEPGDAPQPVIDIQAIAIYDADSFLHVRFDMGADIPVSSPSAQLNYRILLRTAAGECGTWLLVGNTRTAGTNCVFPFGAPFSGVAYSVSGRRLNLYVPKERLRGDQVSWRADVFYPGTALFDQVSYTAPRAVRIASPGGGQDLSGSSVSRTASVYEVFHYPSIPKDFAEMARFIYSRFPPADDILTALTDFRVDDLFNGGPATGGLNVNIGGIGRPAGPGQPFLSSRLQVAVSPTFMGPRFAEVLRDRDREYFNYAEAVGWFTHEIGHRWGAFVRFRNPLSGAVEKLVNGSCDCHWVSGLHSKSAVNVSGDFATTPYAEASPMGGVEWVENSDGTFSSRVQPWNVMPTGFSALDLYLMGLLDPSEVPETFLLANQTQVGPGRFRGTKVPVRAGDIIAAEGPREPPASRSQKDFDLGMYLLHEPGREPYPDKLAQARKIAVILARHLGRATGGRLRINLTNRGDGIGVPRRLSLLAGAGQSALSGAAFAQPLVFEVVDGVGAPVPDHAVSLTASNARLDAASARTDARGRVSVRVTAGSEAAAATVTARVDGAPPVNVPLNVISPAVAISAAGVRNPASLEEAVAPGSLAVVAVSAAVERNGLSVRVNDVEAPILEVSGQQILFQIPSATPPGPASVVVRHRGFDGPPAAANVQPTAPGIFTAGGRLSGGLNDARTTLTVEVTGLGPTEPAAADGVPVPDSPRFVPLARIQALVDGSEAEVAGAFLIPGRVGRAWVGIRLPELADGDHQVQIAADGVFSNVAVLPVPLVTGLLHRYSFTGSARDAILGQDAALEGGASLADGAVVLDGRGGHVSFRPGTVEGLRGATLEVWFTPGAGDGVWSRVFDFGDGPARNMFLTPRNGATRTPRFAITVNGAAQEQQLTAPAELAPGAEAHIAVAIDAEARRGVLYINGQPAATNNAMTLTPADLGRTGNNWLGRSQYPADPYFNGRISEFRIYGRALAPEEVRRSFEAGPDRLP